LIPNSIRISAKVCFDNGRSQEIWFELPSKFESSISDRGEPWLVLLFPCAIATGEHIQIDLPVDPTLIYNLRGIWRVWQSWYSWVNPIKIKAHEEPSPDCGAEAALFFSGGVDSYFSLIGAHSHANEFSHASLTSLLMVWGFDISLSSPNEFARSCEIGEQATRQFNKQFIPIATNLRDLDGFGNRWGGLSHGAALASIGHLVSNKFNHILIGSTHNYSHLSPWGSHPLVDPQFSSANTAIIHYGAASTRVEKMERICAVPEAARALRVCYKLQSASNCSRCSKCLRTMVTFDLLEKQDLAESFDWSEYSLERVAHVFLRNKNDTDFALEIREAALERNRPDIVCAIDKSLRRSKGFRAIERALTTLTETPFLWRYGNQLRRSFIESTNT
jgi:hypothetical protein